MLGLHVVIRDSASWIECTSLDNGERCIAISHSVASISRSTFSCAACIWSLLHAPLCFFAAAIIGGVCADSLRDINSQLFAYWNQSSHTHDLNECIAHKFAIGGSVALLSLLMPTPLAIVAGELIGERTRYFIDHAEELRPSQSLSGI